MLSGLLKLLGLRAKHEPETEDYSSRIRQEINKIMVYRASWWAHSHDEYTLRFLGRDGVSRAIRAFP